MRFLQSKIFLRTISLIIFFGVIFSYLNSYKFFELYTKKNSSVISYKYFEKGLFQFNFKYALKKRSYSPDQDSINIELSSEDILAFRDLYYSSFINYDGVNSNSSVGFISDKKNIWRKSKVILNKNEQLVKIKIHGTSRGPVRGSFTLPNHLKAIYNDKVKKEYLDISRGGYAFKIKIDSEDKFFNGMRRINLLSPYDDWTIVQNSINKYISSLNIITAYGSYKKLFINGMFVGPYLMQEQIGKELLERDFQITNYALMKSNDDWDKAFFDAHYGTTDYTSYDKEQSGTPETIGIAANLLNRLYKGIENKDLKTVYDLMDIDSLAKVAALIKLTGGVSPLHGDNTKYIYNISSGKFQFVYRLEGAPSKLQNSAPAKFDLDKYNNIHYHKVFDLLLNQNDFINLRNTYLAKIINDEENIFKMLDKEYSKTVNFLNEVNFPTNTFKYNFVNDYETLRQNIKIIKNYLEYSKVYVTINKDFDNQQTLKILNDSYTSSYLKKIVSCEDKIHTLTSPIKLNTPKYSRLDGFIVEQNITYVKPPFDCIKSLEIGKDISKLDLDQKNLYFNSAISLKYYDEIGLDEFGDNLIVKELNADDHFQRKYMLNKGQYSLTKDIIFPSNSILIIEAGTNLVLDEDVSILIKGSLIAQGTELDPIIVTNKLNKAFGSFAVIGSKIFDDFVKLDYFQLKGGSEKVINGIYFSGQASFHDVDVNINNSIFEDSSSDDGLNIKFGNVLIRNSTFRNNFGDQIDLDYTFGNIENNIFYISPKYTNEFISDGLDVSGTNVKISNNSFINMTDKGISVGENSNVFVENNLIKNNNMGIAAKDSSEACLNKNNFNANVIDIAGYVKKKMYKMPRIFIIDQNYESTNILNEDNKKIQNYIFKSCASDLRVNS
jgi:parallel beta-helix repeat protein